MLNKLTGLGKAVFCSRVWLALILMCMAVALLYIFLQFLSYTSMPKIQWEVSFDEISADLFIPSLRQSRSGGYSIVCFPDISKSSGIPVCIVNWDGADVRNCRLLYVEKTNDDNVMESGFVESAEGDIVMCGSVSHHASGATCAWVTKINPEGKTEWLLRGDSSGSAWSCWNDIVEAHDSGFVLAGYKELECGRLRVISVMKIDPNCSWDEEMGQTGPIRVTVGPAVSGQISRQPWYRNGPTKSKLKPVFSSGLVGGAERVQL